MILINNIHPNSYAYFRRQTEGIEKQIPFAVGERFAEDEKYQTYNNHNYSSSIPVSDKRCKKKCQAGQEK